MAKRCAVTLTFFMLPVCVIVAARIGFAEQLARAAPVTISNTATAGSANIISYPIERNISGIQLVDVLPVMSEISARYLDEIGKTGNGFAREFAWDFDWNQPYLGAGSKIFDDVFSITLWGGFIRAEKMTIPAIEFTICHELGHLLGGSPHQIIPGVGVHWSSAEGQADWWAASVCLAEVYRARGLSDADVRDRILKAAVDFARFAEFFYFQNEIPVSPAKSAPEEPVATLTLAYPTLQCRLDTVRRGGDCALAATETEKQGACVRPRCWFFEP